MNAPCHIDVEARMQFFEGIQRRNKLLFSTVIQVAASELAAARAEIAKLQRIQGKKTLENEMLKEAAEFAAEKSGLRARPCCQRTTHEGRLRGPGAGALSRICMGSALRSGKPERAGHPILFVNGDFQGLGDRPPQADDAFEVGDGGLCTGFADPEVRSH